jgi:hypothetical protein
VSILCSLKRDNLFPVQEMSPIETLKAKPMAVIEQQPVQSLLKTLPVSPVLEIIDPKEYRIPSDIIQQIVWIPQRNDTINIGETDCKKSFSPTNETDHPLLAMHHGYVAGVLFGAIENWADGSSVFDVRIVCVRKQWRRGGQEELAKEQVGIKLMLAAMKKAQDLCLDIVTLYYFAPCDGDENYVMACRKREGMFKKLSSEIPSNSSLEEYFDMADRYVREKHMTYYLRTSDYTFNFERAMKRFIRGS